MEAGGKADPSHSLPHTSGEFFFLFSSLLVMVLYRIIGQFGLERTLEIILFQTPGVGKDTCY